MQTVIRLRRRRPDSNSCWQAVRRGLAWPLLQAGQLAHVVLSKAMLMTCEVALEYMLGLTYSPQVHPRPMQPCSHCFLISNRWQTSVVCAHVSCVIFGIQCLLRAVLMRSTTSGGCVPTATITVWACLYLQGFNCLNSKCIFMALALGLPTLSL